LVEISLTDGTARSRRIDSVRGAPDRPIPQAEVEAKFRANAARALPPPSVERLIESILSLDRMKTPAPITKTLRQSEG
jgi:2-methylcitrate dehydratase PrpD